MLFISLFKKLAKTWTASFNTRSLSKPIFQNWGFQRDQKTFDWCGGAMVESFPVVHAMPSLWCLLMQKNHVHILGIEGSWLLVLLAFRLFFSISQQNCWTATSLCRLRIGLYFLFSFRSMSFQSFVRTERIRWKQTAHFSFCLTFLEDDLYSYRGWWFDPDICLEII